MPRLTKRALKARLEKAHEQWGSLVLFGLPMDISEEDLRKAEEEAARIESMTHEELEEYYRSPAGRAELAYERKIDRELEELEAIPIEQQPNPLGRKLIRCGKLEFYQNVVTRVAQGMPWKKIAAELGVSVDTIKIALRVVRQITGQNHKHHQHKTPEEFNRCRQCRSFVNQDTRSEYDSDPRKRHKKREVPVSRIKYPARAGKKLSDDEKLDRLSGSSRKDGNRRAYRPS